MITHPTEHREGVQQVDTLCCDRFRALTSSALILNFPEPNVRYWPVAADRSR